MSDNSQNPSLHRAYSARSEDAFSRLEVANVQLTSHEVHFKELVLTAERGPPKEKLIEIKNELALMVGAVDKLQMKEIDTIIVGELDSGKNDARASRKELNKRASELSERIKRLHAAIVKHLASL